MKLLYIKTFSADYVRSTACPCGRYPVTMIIIIMFVFACKMHVRSTNGSYHQEANMHVTCMQLSTVLCMTCTQLYLHVTCMAQIDACMLHETCTKRVMEAAVEIM